MQNQTLYPDYNYDNYVIDGSGIGNDNGNIARLGDLPSSGTTSMASYVDNGIASYDDNIYWTNPQISYLDGIMTFLMSFDKLAVSPEDGFALKYRVFVNTNEIFSPNFNVLKLYLTKSMNPSLAKDEEVGTISSVLLPQNDTFTNETVYIPIDESKRTYFDALGDDAILTLSGILDWQNAFDYSETIKFSEFELQVSGELIGPTDGTVNFWMGEPVSECSKLLLPNSDYVSQVIYSGAIGSDGAELSGLPKTGINSIANYVCEGFDHAVDSTYWGNRTDTNSSTQMRYIITFDDLDIPISGATFKYRTYYNASFGFGFTPAFYNTSLYLRKENNPALTNDIQITSVNPVFVDIHASGYQNSGVYFEINQLGRDTIETLIPNARISVSGDFMFGGNGALGQRARITEMALCVTSQGTDVTNDIDLYTFSSANAYNSIDLFTEAGVVSNSFNQIIKAHEVYDSGLSLSLTGHSPVNSGIDFYTTGIGADNGAINFTLAGKIAYPNSGELMFYTYSASESAIYKSIDMSIGSDFAPNPENNINFSLSGPPSVEIATYINFALGQTPTANSGISFFICNDYALSSGGITFVIKTRDGTEGAVPKNGEIPFVIGRDSESLAQEIPMYLQAPTEISGDIVNMYVNGVYASESGIDFTITGQHVPNQTLRLYTHGY